MKGLDSTVYADNIILAGRQAGRQAGRIISALFVL